MIEVYFDGCCEPNNPGGAIGCGVVVKEDSVIKNRKTFFASADKKNTNNIAEYMAFTIALEDLLNRNLTDAEIVIRGDSQLVIKQMNQEWQVKDGAYVVYAIKAQKLLKRFKNIRLEWVPREQNEEADALSKEELTKRNIKIVDRTAFKKKRTTF